MATTTLAEFLGFAIPGVVGAIAYANGASPWLMYVALVAAGAGEGAVLGLGQSYVLSGELTGFDRRAWIVATALAAAFAWSIGLLPSMVGDAIRNVPVAVVVAISLPLGAALLTSIGVAQWFVMRRYVSGASLWIAVNGVAWLVGLGVSITMMSALITETTPVLAVVVATLLAGALMALSVAVVTGWCVVRIVVARPPKPSTRTDRLSRCKPSRSDSTIPSSG